MRGPEQPTTDEFDDDDGLDVDEAPLDADPTVPESLAQGRKSWTPFALTGVVAITVWSFAALVSAVVFLVWWLA